MEGKKSQLTEEEMDVMDELYFVTSYEDLFCTLEKKRKNLKEILCSLLIKGYIQQMEYKSKDKDFMKKEGPEMESLENFHYLATTKGLLTHNLR